MQFDQTAMMMYSGKGIPRAVSDIAWPRTHSVKGKIENQLSSNYFPIHTGLEENSVNNKGWHCMSTSHGCSHTNLQSCYKSYKKTLLGGTALF